MVDARREGKQSGLIIGPYTLTAAEYLPYNPESPRVAASIAKIIVASSTNLGVDHIGSTAVPGCWGKGIIDLLVLYFAGELELARDRLARLGFQHQTGPDPFPEDRPMRVGDIEYFGRPYRVHAHVILAGSDEARDLVSFRDILRSNSGLRRAYEAEKRGILARGITKCTEYSKAKGDFIRSVLAAAEF